MMEGMPEAFIRYRHPRSGVEEYEVDVSVS